jgi:Rrf2 family cysteine metabolism transcriptional repressor
MQFSTKVRYGLYAMVELACRHDGRPVQLGSVAEHQGISPKYLHAVMQQLKLAGLVRTVRGAKGGFVLTRPPQTIGVIEVIEALDGPVGVTDCSKHQDCECERSSRCVTRKLWCQLSEAIRGVLEGQTLADLAAEVESPIDGLLSPEEPCDR